ncbi:MULTISPECIES: GAF domain-containing protein [Haloferax]|uniref:histidine kinase n=1 Tax=Haloferax marinum TaxID=2666143 RepID=A0A6A8G8H0_9EURY|nr:MULTISPECIES: GAF domain-containing protein [Haloferax]KAB1197527.1 GAF domain-containing protein [Haloferax sp. CBA1150]MRW96573.1 GAF domain-containing protein [Haloferax marinum]
MYAADHTVVVDADFDCDIDLGPEVAIVSRSDGSVSRPHACAVVTNSNSAVSDHAPTILYTDEAPEDVASPERFDAYVERGDSDALETQIRWILSRRSDDSDGAGTERERLKRLYEGTTTLITAATVDELYDRAIGLAEHILEFDNTSFVVHEDDGFYVRANNEDLTGFGPIPTDRGILGQTYHSQESYLVDDVLNHPDAAPDDPAYRSAVSVPMGETGVFQAISNEKDAYDETDLRLAELLVSYVSGTRARIESEAAMRHSREQIERLHRGATELAATTSLTELFERTVEITDDILDFNLSYIGVVEHSSTGSQDSQSSANSDDVVVESGEIVPTAISSDAPEDGAERVSMEDGGIAAKTYRTGETHLVSDIASDADAKPVKRTYRSGLSVPIDDIAVFQAASYVPNAFDENDAELTELLMAHVAVTAERIQAETNLRDERDRSSALFEHVSDAAVAYDVEDGVVTVTDVNQAFEETFGYDAADVVGTDLLGRVGPPESDDSDADDADDDAPELLVAAGESYRGEVRRRTVDEVREFILNVVPLSPGEERGSGYAIYTDITQRKAREEELERQNERLEEFANIVSHDLRNPLGVARGNLQLAREVGGEERFDTVENALDQMESLIDDLLSLARRGQLVDETAPVDLGLVAKQAWMNTETVDATLNTPENVVLDADEDRLGELLANLFRNSIEHGGESAHITVGGIDGGFYVEDDGPGIEPERRDAVFDPGETTGDDGIGYGLAIVESIADAHGWSVLVTSGSAGGARFEFRG